MKKRFLLTCTLSALVLSGCSSYVAPSKTSGTVPHTEPTEPTSDPEPIKELHFKVIHYDSQMMNELQEDLVLGKVFTYTSSLYKGDTPVYHDTRYDSDFLYFGDYCLRTQIPENYQLNLDDYNINYEDGYIERKDGTLDPYLCPDFDQYDNEVRIRLLPKFALAKQYYTVTFKNADGSILGYDYVYKYDYEESGYVPEAHYTGEIPTIYGENHPMVFTGWDKDLSYVTSDMIVTAVYEEDTSINREGINRIKDEVLNYESNGIITAVKNNLDDYDHVKIYMQRDGYKMDSYIIESNQILEFDIEQGYTGIYMNGEASKTTIDAFTVDYNPSYHVQNNEPSDLHKNDDGTYYLSLNGYGVNYIIVNPISKLYEYEGEEIVSTTYISVREASVYANIGTKIIVLDGIECFNLDLSWDNYDPSKDYTNLIFVNDDILLFNLDVGLYNDETIFGNLYLGIYYLPSLKNQYQIGYSGEGMDIASSVTLLTGVNFKRPGYSGDPVTVVIPSSVKSIEAYCNDNIIIFEDSDKVVHVDIDEALCENFTLSKDYGVETNLYFFGNSRFRDSVFENVNIHADMDLEKTIFIDCIVDKFSIIEAETTKMKVVNGCLINSSRDMLISIEHRLLKEITCITAYVKIICENAICDWFDSTHIIKTLIVNPSVQYIRHQDFAQDVRIFTAGDSSAVYISENQEIYRTNSDYTLIEKDDMLFGIKKNDAYVIGYFGPTEHVHVNIPDTITCDGTEFPVTHLEYGLFNNIEIDSIHFGSNLKVIDGTFNSCKINCDIILPDSIESVSSSFNSFVNAQPINIEIGRSAFINSSKGTSFMQSTYDPKSGIYIYSAEAHIIIHLNDTNESLSYYLDVTRKVGLCIPHLSKYADGSTKIYDVNGTQYTESDITTINLTGYVLEMDQTFSTNVTDVYCNVDVSLEGVRDYAKYAMLVAFLIPYNTNQTFNMHYDMDCTLEEYISYLCSLRASKDDKFISSYTDGVLHFTNTGSNAIKSYCKTYGVDFNSLTATKVTVGGVSSNIPVDFLIWEIK